MAILLKNARYLDPETFSLKTGDISVRSAESREIDCAGTVVTRPFTCGHHHAYSAFACGMPAPKKVPRNFMEILRQVWWKLDRALDEQMVYLSALATAAACARSGVAFAIDHHSSPEAIEGSLERITAAFKEIGIGVLPCYEITDRNGRKGAREGLAETERFLAQGNSALIGLHASFTVGDETLEAAIDLMRRYKSGIHLHAAEDSSDQRHCKRKYGMQVIERLALHGVIDSSKSIVAHGIHLSAKERELLQESSAWLAVNTDSNLNNKVGLFSAKGHSDRIFLGTDGMHSDMLKSAQTTYFQGIAGLQQAYRWLRNSDRYLAQHAFYTQEGSYLILEHDGPTPVTEQNVLGHLFYGFSTRQVRDLIVNGVTVLRNRQLTRIDEKLLLERCRSAAEKLWAAYRIL